MFFKLSLRVIDSIEFLFYGHENSVVNSQDSGKRINYKVNKRDFVRENQIVIKEPRGSLRTLVKNRGEQKDPGNSYLFIFIM